jgi:RHS repeat-associated protein
LSYNIAGQMTGLTLGNGVVESYGYDANRLQLTTQTATRGATSLMNLTYNYQATAGQMGQGSTAGNAGHLMSISGTINNTTESAAYTYDLLGRLVTSDQTSNGSSAQRLFEYDRWGNRTAVYDGLPGGKTAPTQIQSVTLPTTFQQGGPAPTNRIGTVTNNGSPANYTYDAAGNVTNDGVHSYTYDVENRVVSVDGGATAQYRYDHKNRRVCKIIGSSWTHYIWEGSRVIAEHDATTAYSTNPTYQVNSARLDYIYSGARMIRSRQRASSTSPWVTQYYLTDRLSVRMTLDVSGNVLGRESHLPFGEDFGESGTQEKHHFTTYERDGESGTDYAVNRHYAQSLGRFRQADPYKPSGYLVDPKSWNRYSYVENDPVNFNDALGLFSSNWVPPPPPDPWTSIIVDDSINVDQPADPSGGNGEPKEIDKHYKFKCKLMRRASTSGSPRIEKFTYDELIPPEGRGSLLHEIANWELSLPIRQTVRVVRIVYEDESTWARGSSNETRQN